MSLEHTIGIHGTQCFNRFMKTRRRGRWQGTGCDLLQVQTAHITIVVFGRQSPPGDNVCAAYLICIALDRVAGNWCGPTSRQRVWIKLPSSCMWYLNLWRVNAPYHHASDNRLRFVAIVALFHAYVHMCLLMESVTQQHELVRSSCSTSVDKNRSGPELTKLKIYIHVPETFFNNYMFGLCWNPCRNMHVHAWGQVTNEDKQFPFHPKA